MDHNQQSRRGHHHRGRRGPDRRGPDRRPQASSERTDRHERQDRPERPESTGPRVDVEQIMRDIRARIAQRSGIELSNQEIEELAARRLEAILDPQTVRPALLDQLRRTAAERTPTTDALNEPAPSPFEEEALYDSRNGLLRALRRLLNPVLRLFINPTPVAHALAVQAGQIAEMRAHAVEQERRHAEWNALQYEILQRLVVEIARVSLEAHALALKVDALTGRVDFADRRVRTLEGTAPAPRPLPRSETAPVAAESRTDSPAAVEHASPGQVAGDAGTHTPDGAPRRRRRRRRGRRGPGAGAGFPQGSDSAVELTDGPAGEMDLEEDGGDEDTAPDVSDLGHSAAAPSPASSAAPAAAPEPRAEAPAPESSSAMPGGETENQ